MTEKQKRFCEEYAMDLNHTAAALRAGYTAQEPHNTAWHIMQNPEAREYVAALQAERRLRQQIDGDKIVQQLLDIATGKTVTTEYAYGRTSRMPIPQRGKEPSFSERLKAIELLAKLTGAFTTANLAARAAFQEPAVGEVEIVSGDVPVDVEK